MSCIVQSFPQSIITFHIKVEAFFVTDYPQSYICFDMLITKYVYYNSSVSTGQLHSIISRSTASFRAHPIYVLTEIEKYNTICKYNHIWRENVVFPLLADVLDILKDFNFLPVIFDVTCFTMYTVLGINYQSHTINSILSWYKLVDTYINIIISIGKCFFSVVK